MQQGFACSNAKDFEMITFILVVAAFAGGVAVGRKWQKVVDFDFFEWLKSHIG